jgi:hypothetical protein
MSLHDNVRLVKQYNDMHYPLFFVTLSQFLPSIRPHISKFHDASACIVTWTCENMMKVIDSQTVDIVLIAAQNDSLRRQSA